MLGIDLASSTSASSFFFSSSVKVHAEISACHRNLVDRMRRSLREGKRYSSHEVAEYDCNVVWRDLKSKPYPHRWAYAKGIRWLAVAVQQPSLPGVSFFPAR